MNKLHDYQKTSLAPLEKALKKAVADAEPDAAIETAGRIRELFPDNPRHPRLLRAKLWAFEAMVPQGVVYEEVAGVGV